MRDSASDKIYVPIVVGTFECNDASERYVYRQLAAAGLIEYSVERYAWWEKSTEKVKESYRVLRGWYYTYYDTEYRWVKKPRYDFCDHYVVNVSLTKKGNRLVVDELPMPENNVDEDMIQPHVDADKYVWNDIPVDENWPYIANPFVKAVSEKAKSTENGRTGSSESVGEISENEHVERIDSLMYEKYNGLSLEYQVQFIHLADISAVKSRNIIIGKTDMGNAVAEAEVIYELSDVSDAGRIMENMENGMKSLKKVTLTFYEDKGWVIDGDSTTESGAIDDGYAGEE